MDKFENIDKMDKMDDTENIEDIDWSEDYEDEDDLGEEQVITLISDGENQRLDVFITQN